MGFIELAFATALLVRAEGEVPAPPGPTLWVGARVHARYMLRDETASQTFGMRRVRFYAELRPTSRLRAQVEIDPLDVPSVKDAYVRAELQPGFAVTAGQFKKPFSLVALTSSRSLPLARRGLLNDHFAGGLELGGRDLGLMLDGEVGQLEFALGAFNGSPTLGDSDVGRDAAVRLEWKAPRDVRLGMSGGVHSQVLAGQARRRLVRALGADTRVKTGPVRWHAEAIMAREPIDSGTRDSFGAILYSFVRLPVTEELELRPIAKLETLGNDLRRSDRAWAGLIGCNLHIGRSLRLFLQGERVWAGARSEVNASRSVIVQLAFDHVLPIASRRGDDE